MPKRADIVIIAVGAVLILSALLLLIYNRCEDVRAGQEAESLLASVEAAISAQEMATPNKPESTEALSPPLDPEMPVVTLGGYEYVGYVEIPTLGLKLPVMAEWDYTRLQIAPCRQFGSSRTDNLVIAAHNYDTHFGKLRELSEGETVLFTDMEGIVSTYCVEKLETLSPDAVDTVLNSGYDLVLYTCTKGGRTRVIVFCDRAAETASSSAPRQTEK